MVSEPCESLILIRGTVRDDSGAIVSASDPATAVVTVLSLSDQPSLAPTEAPLVVSITPANATYFENGQAPLPLDVNLDGGILDPTEEVFLEIDMSTAPPGAQIFLNGVDLTQDPGNFNGTWLLVPAADASSLIISSPEGSAGIYDVLIRGTVRDDSGAIVSSSDPITAFVTVLSLSVRSTIPCTNRGSSGCLCHSCQCHLL